MSHMKTGIALILSTFVLTHGAWGQSEEASAKEKASVKADEPELGPWTKKLSLGVNTSFGSSSSVIGQTDGESSTFGFKLDSELNYKTQKHEWRQSFNLNEATTKSPTIPRYVKSNDEIKYSTTYLYKLDSYPWLGPYAKLSAESALFFGEDVREKVVNYEFASSGQTLRGDSLRLTDGLKPMTTKESLGVLAKIIDRKHTKLELNLGVAALQVAADEQLAVSGTKDNDVVTIDELKSFDQMGVEFGLNWKGKWDKKSSYELAANAMVPVVNDFEPEAGEDDKSDLELTNYDLLAKVNTKVYDWAIISYEYKLKKQPELLDKLQTQHLLTLSFAYDVF